jgi:hypothetical protein
VPTETVFDRSPAVRCYECGSTEILSLCHHCGKPMCVQHSNDAFSQTANGQDGSAKPTSREFSWLKQSDPRRGAVYHCAEHSHKVGLWTLLLERFSSGQDSSGQVSLPRLPVFPHVNTVEIVERLSGQVSFANGVYRSTVDGPVAGTITFDMSANGGQEWLRHYRKKYRKKYRLQGDEAIPFTAGSAMIKGTAGVRFAAGQDVVLADGTGIAFVGSSAAEHPLFHDVPGHPPGEWIFSAHYEVHAASAPEDIPLWIVPSVVPSSDRKTLEIDLHWNELGPETRRLNLVRFDLVELEVPATWGAVQPAPGGATIDSGRKGRRVVRWRQLPPEGDGGVPQRQAVLRGAKSRMLRLSFENAVLPGHDNPQSPEQADPQFAGTLTAIFEQPSPGDSASAATLSGIEGVDIYLPGGGSARQQPEVKVRTEVTVRFGISLDAIRYQERWSVPKQSNARLARVAEERQPGDAEASPDVYRRDDETFYGVVPNFQTVAELTNLISRKNYYVKSVVEHDPQPGYEPGGEVVKRVWDIAGRWYYGVFPIGFDINLRGVEFAADAPLRGRTTVQITVNGTYANDPGLTQRKMIEERWDDLHDQVTGLLHRLAASIGGVSAIEASATDGYVRENRFAHDPIVVDAVIVDGEPPGAPANGHAGERDEEDEKKARRAELIRQMQDADAAVLAGRIREETHAGIVARLRDELDRLGG